MVESQSNPGLYSFKPYQCTIITPTSAQVPIARSGHRIVYFNGQIFSFGGYNKEVFANDMGKL